MEPDSIKDRIHRDFLGEHDRPWKSYTLDLAFPPLHHSAKSPLPCRETPEELEEASRQFSAGVRELFEGLASLQFYIDWQHRRTRGRGPPLIDPEGLHLTIRILPQDIAVPYGEGPPRCPHRVYHARRLRLLLPADLALLSARLGWIKGLTVDPAADDDEAMTGLAGARLISPLAPLEIAASLLPALRELRCDWLWERGAPASFAPHPEPHMWEFSAPMAHYARLWEGPWRDARHEFGNSSRASAGMVDRLPAGLKRMRLWFWRADGFPDDDQVSRMPDLVRPAPADPFSAGLRALAARLEVLDLRAMVMPDVFSSAGQTSWSGGMRRLRVEFHPCRPDGSWYFVGPRGEDPHPLGFEVGDEHYPPAVRTREDEEVDEDYDEDQSGFGRGYEHDARRHDLFRVEPAAERVEPLLEAFGGALGGMKDLEEAELFAWLTWQPSDERAREYGGDDLCDDNRRSWRWGVRYVSARDGAKARVEWRVGEWRPKESTMALFESLGGDTEVEVVWQPLEKQPGRETWKDDDLWR